MTPAYESPELIVNPLLTRHLHLFHDIKGKITKK
jgi:hypothetical protein